MKVLVYGTLKMDYGNHLFLTGAKYLKTDEFSIPNHELKARKNSAFPYLVETGNTESFIGELYEVTEDIIVGLDMLEGHPNFYRRKEYTVDGDKLFVYVIPEKSTFHKELLDLPTIGNF